MRPGTRCVHNRCSRMMAAGKHAGPEEDEIMLRDGAHDQTQTEEA